MAQEIRRKEPGTSEEIAHGFSLRQQVVEEKVT